MILTFLKISVFAIFWVFWLKPSSKPPPPPPVFDYRVMIEYPGDNEVRMARIALLLPPPKQLSKCRFKIDTATLITHWLHRLP